MRKVIFVLTFLAVFGVASAQEKPLFVISQPKSAIDYTAMLKSMQEGTDFVNRLDQFDNDRKNPNFNPLERQTEQKQIIKDYLSKFENGVGGRGGGQGVYLKDGSFRFLDLLDKKLFPSVKFEIVEPPQFSENDPNCSHMGLYTLGGGFADAQRLAEHELKDLIAQFPEYTMLIELFKLTLKSEKIVFINGYYPWASMDQWKDSPTIPKKLQVPIALFNSGVLFIIYPLFQKLPLFDQAALLVHESLRQMMIDPRKYKDNTNSGLNVGALEKLVRHLMLTKDFEVIGKILMMDQLRDFNKKRDALADAAIALKDHPNDWQAINHFFDVLRPIVKEIETDALAPSLFYVSSREPHLIWNLLLMVANELRLRNITQEQADLISKMQMIQVSSQYRDFFSLGLEKMGRSLLSMTADNPAEQCMIVKKFLGVDN